VSERIKPPCRCSLTVRLETAMAKAIREASGKAILAKTLEKLSGENGVGNDLHFPVKSVTVTPKTDFFQLAVENPWLKNEVSRL